MKIYTKILIGMAVGVVVGFTLGPNSALLTHDLIEVTNPARVKLLDAPGGTSKGIALPPSHHPGVPPIELRIQEQRHAGKSLYYRVKISVEKRLALRDPNGRLKPGQELEGWVKADGLPAAMSAFGTQLVSWLDPIGRLFLKLIKMVIVPLVFASLLVGVASLGDVRKLGRLGGKTLGYFLLTTVLAISIGLALANIIKPGNFVSPEDKERLVAQYSGAAKQKTTWAAEQPSAVDNLLAIVPDNPMKSLAGGDMLQIIFFAGILGIALTLLPQDKTRGLVGGFEAINDAMIVVVNGIMKVAPYGVLALVAKVVGQSGVSVLKGRAAASRHVAVPLVRGASAAGASST